MKNLKQVYLVGASALVAVLTLTVPSFAAGSFDFTSIATAISTEITSDLPAFATVMGIVVGIPMVWHLFRKMTR